MLIAETDLQVSVDNIPAVKVVKGFNDTSCTKPCDIVIKVISAHISVDHTGTIKNLFVFTCL